MEVAVLNCEMLSRKMFLRKPAECAKAGEDFLASKLLTFSLSLKRL